MYNYQQQMLITVHLLVAGLAGALSIPLYAGGGAIGMVARSVNSEIGGHTASAFTTLFDGDRLEAEGITIVKLKSGSQITMAPNTVASFAEGANDVTVKLKQGAVTLHRANSGPTLRVEAGDVLVVPASGYRTLGEVAMRDGKISVKASEGAMFLQGPSGVMQATKGKTITLPDRSARSPQPAGSGVGATQAAAGLGHAAKVGGLAAGGVGATLGAASQAGGSRAGGSMGAMSFAGGSPHPNSASANGEHEKNPIAVEEVANHVPDQACQHAASPSVPWVACGPGSIR